MGKKYIIELLDDCPIEFKGIIVFGLTPEGQISAEPIPVEDLTPYTEPDLERVRKEAYQKGYADAKCGYENGFENGMVLAWDVAKKIVCYEIDGGYPIPQMLDLFNRDDLPKILSDYTASEAIEKIRQYEQEKEEMIDIDKNKVEALANDIGIHKLYALVKEIRGE